MAGTVDLGVFLPVSNNGWIVSKTSPQFLPTFALNRRVCEIAEEIGFSYVFSMAKWRGFGGATDFWKWSLESTMLMGGLAAYVPKLRLIASVAPALIHPAVFAKMAATLDDVTGGRLGINIVSAANPGEYTQMALYPPNFEDFRYDYTEEWLTVVKRLWTDDSVTLDGKYFTLDDCESFPKPVQAEVPLVCATSSERGFRFVAEHCTDGFFGASDMAQHKAQSLRMKAIAGAYGRPVRTHTLIMLIQGDTDDEARRTFDHYADGADLAAIESVYRKRVAGKPETKAATFRDRYEGKDSRLFYAGFPFVGGPERIADMIEELAVEGEVDGCLCVFPDFVDGLERFGAQVMPILRRRGLIADVAVPALSSSRA
jgi:pyrimidine oxygenase